MEVKFYEQTPDYQLKFAVIIAKAHGKWVFCRHRQRDTYELPGGHREAEESILDAATRELREETGALDFSLIPVCAYSVVGKNQVNPSGEEAFGMLYAADIIAFEPELHHEIDQVLFLDELPRDLKPWTYPMIQPKLVEEAKRRNLV